MTPRARAARLRGPRAFPAPRLAALAAAFTVAGLGGAAPSASARPAALSPAPDRAGAHESRQPPRGARSGDGSRAAAVRLRGLMRVGDRAVALLEFDGGRLRRLQPGETVAGWALLRVEAERVVLESPTGEPVEIGLAEPSGAPAERSPADAAPAEDAAEPADGPAADSGPDTGAAGGMPVDAMPADAMAADGMMAPGPAPPVPSASPSRAASGGGERRFSRDEVRLRLATELPRILTGATVVPRIDGDEVVGLELVSFPTDTILGETGLLPNDVLLRVNDREVRGVESLAVLVQRFQTASRIELAVERGGEVLSLRYAIE